MQNNFFRSSTGGTVINVYLYYSNLYSKISVLSPPLGLKKIVVNGRVVS